MTDDEKDRALCEAHCNSAADEYFNARPHLDSDVNRRIFYAGHRKAWIERGEAVRLNAQAAPDTREMFNAGWCAAARFCDRDYVVYGGLVGPGGCPAFEETYRAASTTLSAAPAAPQPAQQPLTDEQRKSSPFLVGLSALQCGAKDVLAERQRQINAEGWTPEHDDEHADGDLALAAACYALPEIHREVFPRKDPRDVGRSAGESIIVYDDVLCPILWPWHGAAWKPKDRRTDLVKAGALILAEIERIDRAIEQAHGIGVKP